MNNNILVPINSDEYGLIDEFLKIRILMDNEQLEAETVEKEIISGRIPLSYFDNLSLEQYSENDSMNTDEY